MTEADSLPADMKLSSLQDPGDRYKLGDLLGSGAYSEVFEATDQNSGKIANPDTLIYVYLRHNVNWLFYYRFT